MSYPNYLAGGLVPRPDDKKSMPPNDVMSLLSASDGRYVKLRSVHAGSASQTPHASKRLRAGKGTSQERRSAAVRSGSRFKDGKSDADSMKIAKRMLKFTQAKGGF